MKNTSARNLWGDYLDKHLEYAFSHEPKVSKLGENEKEVKELLKLVLSGKKRAMSHSLLGLQYREEPLPRIGDFTVLTDWHGDAKCVLRTVAVRLKPFFSIRESYSKVEGEGDLSLAYWKTKHWAHYTKELEAFGRVPRESMIIVCEYFEKVFER
ncbi:ASCH domain-containing protein [uncultured Eudoraea sp.]|uniref:ASCH domain-containing protein n=1 Tax=uncultured Eudoraea sp. TaxID=1035614 RepID=UPI0026076170|nr:ASCH domain-containing protein [uncultured Eudoraea sp.]